MIFEPAWRATLGPLTETGKGLLGPLSKQLELLDSFLLLLGTHTVNVKPKTGQIYFDSSLVLQLVHPGTLIWARTMQKEMQAGQDKNSAPFDCAFYKVGLEDKTGQKHGWRLYADGRMLKGGL